jgi:hypothetical protein
MDTGHPGRHGRLMLPTESPPAKVPERAIARLLHGLDYYLARLEEAERRVNALALSLPETVVHDTAEVIGLKAMSYRDGLMIQLAFGLEAPASFDHTKRASGARGVGQQLGKAHRGRHIAGVNDAYENIGKNSVDLVRGNIAPFDRLLGWMNVADAATREALLTYIVARVALTARPVSPMPELARTALTFVGVSGFLEDLMSVPSGGAYEQFAVTAFLGALVDQFGLGGVGALGVKTKNINASDASAGTAADVQIMRGGMVEEAFEVSANDWRTKVDQAIQAARNADLPRAHVLASNGDDLSGLEELLEGTTVDVSVMETRAFLRVLCGVLKKPGREDALRRLYDATDRLQADVARTNRIVELLGRHGLTA